MSKLYKIQRPLSGDMTDVLIYDEGRRNVSFAPYDNEMKETFQKQGNPPRLYVKGEIKEGYFIIYRIPVKQDYIW
jgi:hypothetical protein